MTKAHSEVREEFVGQLGVVDRDANTLVELFESRKRGLSAVLANISLSQEELK